MNAFQICRNTVDAVPLYLPQQLFLKPIACITISIQLPNLKKLEKCVSHWEIMEKIRAAIRPDEFSTLKVVKTTSEFVRFEGELDNKTRLDRVVSKLDCNSIKLKDIPDLLRLRAMEKKSDFPTKHKWDTFFQDAKDMDEMKPGQRPDTIHLSHLPVKWFVPYHMNDDEDVTPSEKMFFRIFEKFGPIRYVDIPVCDPYRKKMKDHISGIKEHSFDDKTFFEGYVQFKDYIGFCNAMSALKGMKLLRKDDDEALCVHFKADFDRTKHLSDASIRRREIVRDRLVRKQREKEEKEKNTIEDKRRNEKNERQNAIKEKNEKEQRRREREEKRKAKILEKLKINGCDEINEKIAREEKKLLKAQRKLEAIRLVEELFRRIKEKKGDELTSYNKIKKKQNEGSDELKSLKNNIELEVLTQRQKLHNALEGRVILKSILTGRRSRSNSSSSSESSDKNKKVNPENLQMMFDPWYNYGFSSVPPPAYYQPGRGHPTNFMMLRGRNRPGPSRGRPFSRRGYYRGGRGHFGYNPEIEEQYFKYFSKFLNEHDTRVHSRSRSRSRRRSRYSRSRSRTRSKSHRRSRSRSRSRSYRSQSRFTPPISRERTRSRTRSRSRRKEKSKSKTKSSQRRSQTRSKSRDERSRSKRRDKSKSRSKSNSKNSYSKSRSKSKENCKSREKSVDSSGFVSPNQMRKERSKSWSLPKNDNEEPKERSWSKSPKS